MKVIADLVVATRRLAFAGFTVALLLVPAGAAETPEDFFEAKIRPVLVERCYECHGEKKTKGGLRLDTREATLKGGDTAPALVAGDPTKSLLVKAIHWADKDFQMPPKEKLPDGVIADFEQWIKMGAPDPRIQARQVTQIEKHLEAAKAHWAFQPLPAVSADATIDGFIDAKLATAKLTPAPPADKRTLMRRAYLDLLGVLPTDEEVQGFTSNDDPQAWAQLIDRLLSDPRYGERWGRHWLDVARYADNQGSIGGSVADDLYPYAFSYRDYVIGAFNADLPYDRFITEQLAADLVLKGGDNRSLAALGFLTVSRQYDRRLDNDVIDDRIDVIGRGLLGLTIGCARCHDHKLEPVTTKDYYGLYGVLMSCKSPDVLPTLSGVAPTEENRAYDTENKKLRAEYAGTIGGMVEDAFRREWPHVGSLLLAVHDTKGVSSRTDSRLRSGLLKERALNFTLYDQIILAKPEFWTKNAALFGPWQALAKLGQEEFATAAAALSTQFAANSDHALDPAVAALFDGAPPANLEEVAKRYDGLFGKVIDRWFAENAAALTRCRELDAKDLGVPTKLLYETIIRRITDLMWTGEVKPGDGPANLFRSKEGPWSFGALSTFYATQSGIIIEPESRPLLKAAREITKLDAEHPGAPVRAMALEESKPFDAKVFVRGNPLQKGPDAPRGFLQTLTRPGAPEFPKDASGRLQLAQAITQHPLTARVIVNRVWQGHFGEGLVRSSSDFGFRGERPSHPELLEHLAAWFLAHGQSFKELHRVIMLSQTYRRSSVWSGAGDPDNRLLARFPARPLEFEPFRDAALQVSGRLDGRAGGKPVDLTQNTPTSLRRTVYGFVDRKTTPGLYRAFDFPDASFTTAKRSRTALSPRALLLLNSPLFHESARSLAQRVAQHASDEALRVEFLYRQVFQRAPTPEEAARALAFLAAYPQRDLVQPEAQDWQYGFGEFDPETKTVKNFAPLKSYDGKKWRSDVALADGKKGDIMLDPQGGNTGPLAQHSSVRRWTAPLDGRISIEAELIHHQEQGEGVSAFIVHSRLGLLGEWRAHYESKMTAVKEFAVQRGDVIDFIVRSQAGAETYRWAPVIKMPTATLPGMKDLARRWDAKLDFANPAQPPVPMTAWEELCHVMLMSNEFAWLE
jgi:hypothetical protein